MYDTPRPIAELLGVLAAAPARMAQSTAALSAAQLRAAPAPGQWSANDILAHLRACADVWGKSILAMIAQDHPTLRYVSPRTYIRKTKYPELAFGPSLQAFTEQRRELLKALRSLKAEDWSRGATFTGTTSGREMTIADYVRRLALHENDHCAQIEALLK